ncbi:DUF6924 domain-containing protein [[Kitasatospora] papulosa]|uniref:DUF6924 domain-containing protein n=1 Tax=Streptomyces TaxID=1883 RepID=UPI0033B28F37
MKNLPDTDDTLLIRTDYSDQAAWQALLTAVTTPNKNGFLANVHVVDDVAYSDLTTEQAVSVARARGDLLIVADTAALTGPEMPLLAVLPFDEDDDYDEDDEYDEDEDEDDDDETKQEHGELRVIATELWSIENNISLANMDWEDFVNAADEGVFRGF